MFPNLLYRDSLSKYNEKELSIAAKFVELLVSSGLVRDKLNNMYGTRNPNHLFSEIKTVVLNDLTAQPYAVVTQLESCIAATIDWLKKENVGNSKPQQRHSTSRVDESLDFELSPSPPPPPPQKSTRMTRTSDSHSASPGSNFTNHSKRRLLLKLDYFIITNSIREFVKWSSFLEQLPQQIVGSPRPFESRICSFA